MEATPAPPSLEFSTPIYDVEAPVTAAVRESIVSYLLGLREHDGGVVRSNRGGWHSAPELNVSDDTGVRSSIDRVAQVCELFLRGVGELTEADRLTIRGCWATINGAHDWNAPHSHHGSAWSAVWYLRAPRSTTSALDGQIIFIDPLGRRHGHPTMCNVQPVDGHVLLFPADLVHMVAPHEGPDPRMSVALNFDVV